ncbi:YlmH family RNA-binding protein [Paenibacillus roseipurpureus]|uniref:YlmH/Sll1252 family protein n=1 Tax=Paenibacillus roseopurpureus TaxID=2918901 RepID=A0AA96RN64_9BACL|nr:YlmH/Sll1252 family protein [Paenibacillus sp. MBLB1832]WNR47029.1 YlmH/Sll1252 family protein [Paenibacillus sp. MBLB1832]
MLKDIYGHFHSDEHHFVDKALDWVERAAGQHVVKLTDFLDPRQAFILNSLVNRNADVHCRFDGGYDAAERRRALIAPDYRVLEGEDMAMAVLSVSSGDGKFLTLEHGDYMGAILGLGMKRDKVGDIHVIEGGCHCLVTQDAADYLHLNLSQVHRVHVQTELLPLEQLQLAKVQLEELHLSVASMRMDGIVSDVFRLSRAKILQPIQAGRCRVNWKLEEDPSKPLKEGDLISLQGFGRFKVLEVEGISKKGRIRVKIGKYA